MNKKLIPIILLTAFLIGCQNKTQVMNRPDPQNLDTTAVLGNDFYQYACGGWIKNHPLTGEYARFGSFDLLAENNREQLKSLIEEIAQKEHTQGSIEQKIADLYNLAMDSVQLNKEGIEPIKGELKAIGELKTKEQVIAKIAQLRLMGADPFFTLFVTADDMASSNNIVVLYQSGLGMGEREYYLDQDEHTLSIRNKYKEHVGKMFLLSGFSDKEASEAVQSVMEIETAIAKAWFDNVKLRDPYANYHKMTLAELTKEFPSFNWNIYFQEFGLKIDSINISQKEMITASSQIINQTPIARQIAYLQWNLINASAGYLSDNLTLQNFDFYGKTMSGIEEMKPRWKRAVSTVDGSLSEAVGQMYVKKYFPASSKEKMLKLVGDLQAALGERIKGLEWMSDSTKVKALEKLSTFYVKIGYPDKWRDYSDLKVEKDSYWNNIVRSTRFEYSYMLSKAGKKVDKTEWLMPPQMVNAYYNPATNEICFPAGILQYPFFDAAADDAFNYGAIGVVIGHEMTHGFDDQGRQYDKEGNLKDWWTKEDAVNFDKRAEVMINFFDSIEVAPGVKANGRFTLGENIADHGGLQVAFQAFKNATKNQPLKELNGFTAEQRFFLSYCGVWAGNIRAEEILNLTKSDPHSLGKWRVNGALPHIDAWYQAFNITEKDKMYIAPEKRVKIW